MTNAPPQGYSIDTNIIVDGRRRLYPANVFQQLWVRFEDLIAQGRAVCSREVVTELEKNDDDCLKWTKGTPNFVVEADASALLVVGDIANGYPDWSSGGKNLADPFVIAEAEIRSWVVVTQERAAGAGVAERNLKIPNVCGDRGVGCVNFVEMMEIEGWTF